MGGVVPQHFPGVVITGTGSYVPEHILTNADLEKMVETSDEWIVTRTGVRERRIAGAEETCSDMGAAAARKALAMAGVAPEDIDLIIVASISPDMPFPATACVVQAKIGAHNAFAFDLEAACTGFLYGLEVGRGLVASGCYDRVLVIAAEKISAITDWQNRNTCVLFGDGAGAAVLERGEVGSGIVASHLQSDGRAASILSMPGGGSQFPASYETVDARMHYLQMEGREVFKFAVNHALDSAFRMLEKADIQPHEVAVLLSHQANLRIINAFASRLGIQKERIHLHLEKYGNMSAASVAVGLDEIVRDGIVKPGSLILAIAFGGGMTWGSMLIRWQEEST